MPDRVGLLRAMLGPSNTEMSRRVATMTVSVIAKDQVDLFDYMRKGIAEPAALINRMNGADCGLYRLSEVNADIETAKQEGDKALQDTLERIARVLESVDPSKYIPIVFAGKELELGIMDRERPEGNVPEMIKELTGFTGLVRPRGFA